MKYALVNNIKKEAETSGELGRCPCCESKVRAHCGEKYIHHWKHVSTSHCDPWWENETQWHREWKNHFQRERQEVVHSGEEDEKHIADVKTQDGWVIEFQHSYINPEERRSRNEFYTKLVWIINGSRRKTDLKQFEECVIDLGTIMNEKPLIFASSASYNFRFFEEWGKTNHLVFLDFKDCEECEKLSDIWCLLPAKTDEHDIWFMRLNTANLIKFLKNGRFDKWFNGNILRDGKKGNLSQAIKKLEDKKHEEWLNLTYSSGS